MKKLNAKQLRLLTEEEGEKIKFLVKRQPIFFILEDIYDTYNIGSFFRLADALAVEEVYLCGTTETPPNIKIKRAAVGTDKVVPWRYKKTTQEAIKEIKGRKKNKNLQVIAVEQDKRSVDYTKADYRFPLALIFGNETRGVSKETLDRCHLIIELPMYGVNRSLNVFAAASVVGYWVCYQLELSR